MKEMDLYTTQEEAIRFLSSCAKRLMEKEQIGRQELADKMKISLSSVDKLVKGRRIGWTIIRIVANFFGYKITSIGCVLADKDGNPVALNYEKDRKI